MSIILYILFFFIFVWPLEEVILKYWFEKGDKLYKWLQKKLK